MYEYTQIEIEIEIEIEIDTDIYIYIDVDVDMLLYFLIYLFVYSSMYAYLASVSELIQSQRGIPEAWLPHSPPKAAAQDVRSVWKHCREAQKTCNPRGQMLTWGLSKGFPMGPSMPDSRGVCCEGRCLTDFR